MQAGQCLQQGCKGDTFGVIMSHCDKCILLFEMNYHIRMVTIWKGIVGGGSF
jgi:hypothetical protein